MMEKHVRFTWPFAFEDIFEFDLTTGRNTRLTARFEEYVSDVQNWTFERSVLEEYPELAGQVPIYPRPFDVAER